MARDRIKSRASFKSEVWMGTEVPRPRSQDTDCKGPELVSGEESGFVMAAGGSILSDSPALSSIAANSPTVSRLPSSDLVMRSGSKARAVVGAANPWKIKSPRMSATYFRFRNLI